MKNNTKGLFFNMEKSDDIIKSELLETSIEVDFQNLDSNFQYNIYFINNSLPKFWDWTLLAVLRLPLFYKLFVPK